MVYDREAARAFLLSMRRVSLRGSRPSVSRANVEFASAGETTTAPNLRENSRNRFSASAIESSTMHRKPLMIDSPILKEAAKERKFAIARRARQHARAHALPIED